MRTMWSIFFTYIYTLAMKPFIDRCGVSGSFIGDNLTGVLLFCPSGQPPFPHFATS